MMATCASRGLARLSSSARSLPSELLIHVGNADGHGFAGSALQLRIERGVDAETLGEQLGFGETVEQVILHHVHEIRRVAVLQACRDDLQRRALGFALLLAR